MKKLVLLISFFSLVTLTINAKTDQKIKTMKEPGFCWQFANTVEAMDCGSVGCDTEFWFYVYDSCMAVE
jgi:hypothetical protein